MRERGGRTRAMTIVDTSIETVQPLLFAHIEIGSSLLTDEATAYNRLDSFVDAVAGKRITYKQLTQETA